MIRVPATAAMILGATLLGACSIDVNDTGPGYDHDDRHVRQSARLGERLLVVYEPAVSREDARYAMEQTMDRMRAAGCSIVQAESWRRIAEIEGPDLRGARVSANCPQSAELF